MLAEREPASGDPFFLLSEEEDVSRVYLAVIKGDPESIVDFCAIKLLRSAYRTTGPEDQPFSSNLAVEQEWSQEIERIRDFRSSARVAPRLISPNTEAQTGALPPLFFCRTGRRLFSPPCPRCGAPLSTCRDDALLASAGLPLFASSLDRFLHCQACNKEDPEAPFYAFEVPEKNEHKLVLAAADLFRDVGESLAGGAETEEIRSRFPCPDCVEAARKFQTSLASGHRAAPFWEDRWEVLTFYDSPYLVTGFGALALDDIADLFGGRPPESFAEEKAALPALAASTRFRYPAGGELRASAGRLLFGAESSGLDAVEVLYLKLVAFGQAVEAALEYTRAFGRPHLDLHPRHFLFDFSRAGEDLPWLWGFQARLHGLSSAARPEKLAGSVEILVPSHRPNVPYAAPEVLEFHLTLPRPAQLVVTELEAAGRGASTYRLHGRLSDPYGIYPSPRDHDWILVLLDNDALGLSNVALPARRDPRGKPAAQELAFISEPIALEESTAERLRKTAGGRIPGTRYRVYADFNVPSDLYSLGVMLLRLLVGNDLQDAKSVARAAERVAQGLVTGADAATGTFDPLDRDPEAAAVLQKANVFYQALDRAENRPNAIPDAVWRRTVLLGLRLATRVAGFSVCADPSDYDPDHPTAKLETTMQEVNLLAAELRTLLFERQAIHVEIQQILSEVMSERLPGDRAGRISG